MQHRLKPIVLLAAVLTWAVLGAGGALAQENAPGAAPEQDGGVGEPAGASQAAPLTQPGALDQVERWIDENIDPEDRNATQPGDAPALALPGGLTSGGDSASIDWGTGSVVAVGEAEITGQGYNPAREEAMAFRQATLQARKKLLDAVFALPLDGRRLVSEELSDSQKTELRGKLRNSPIQRHSEPLEDGGARIEVRASVSLRGALLESALPATEPFQSRIPPRIELTSPVAAPSAADGDQEEYRRSMAELGAYTGVLVDARGLDAAPALLPLVVGADGEAAYGSFLAPRSLVLEQGLAVYVQSPGDDAARRRVGGTPLEVRALAVSGEHRADLVVSLADAELIRTLLRIEDIAGTCPVAVVMD